MNILADLNSLIFKLRIPTETAIFSDVAPDEYVVITPLADTFPLFASNLPEFETQEARLSIYSKGNYVELKNRITDALLAADFTITSRYYVGHEDDTKYHHTAIDVAHIYPIKRRK